MLERLELKGDYTADWCNICLNPLLRRGIWVSTVIWHFQIRFSFKVNWFAVKTFPKGWNAVCEFKYFLKGVRRIFLHADKQGVGEEWSPNRHIMSLLLYGKEFYDNIFSFITRRRKGCGTIRIGKQHFDELSKKRMSCDTIRIHKQDTLINKQNKRKNWNTFWISK